MAGTISEKNSGSRDEYWREQIAAHERSGLSVQRFCKEQGLNDPSFYYWRKRLRQKTPVRFALIETKAGHSPKADLSLELVLPTGERLRIGADVNVAALRTVLEVLRK
jgi:transposase-like protein